MPFSLKQKNIQVSNFVCPMLIIWGLLGRRSFQQSKKIESSDSMEVLSRGRDFVPQMIKYKKNKIECQSCNQKSPEIICFSSG
jgi:hypothetical protein